MAKPGKRLRELRAKIDRKRAYPLDEAIGLLKACAKAKFDESIEVALNLGVDPRHADQMVRGTADLPHGTGKSIRVAVFARPGIELKEKVQLIPMSPMPVSASEIRARARRGEDLSDVVPPAVANYIARHRLYR